MTDREEGVVAGHKEGVVTAHEEGVDERLARLRRATEALRPRAGFNRRVMAAIEAEAPAARLYGIARPARRFLAFAALAAAVSMVWAVRSEGAVDEALAASSDAVELEW